MTREEKIRGRKISVVGMARSGMAVAKMIQRLGGFPFVTDSAPASALTAPIAALESCGIPYETGGHTERALECDFAVLSPVVSPRSSIALRLAERGIPLFSELEVAWWQLQGRMIAITGANGKTTTTHMIYDICRAAGFQTWICGNVGTPLSAFVLDIPATGVAVTEVSSYQLELIEEFRPHVGVILNLTPDHLERHGDMSAYRAAKLRITENQTPRDTLVINIESPALRASEIATQAKINMFGQGESLTKAAIAEVARGVFQRGESLYSFVGGREVTLMRADELCVPGAHNVENAMAAASACLAFGVAPSVVADALRAFKGVEHRIEFVREIGGVRYVNDSKATNLDATTRALLAMNSPTLLILGGRGKKEDFRELSSFVQQRVRSIVAIGETKNEIFSSLGKTAPVEFADSLHAAVARLSHLARPGETVLLSPGCASFDMFDDYEHRGREFKRAVGEIAVSGVGGVQ